MGKKKLSLKPVQRGVATTSIAKKVEIVDESPVIASGDLTDSRPAAVEAKEGGISNEALKPNEAKEDWEDEKSVEEAALQGLVDRLHEKGEKEVSRILKAIEFDKRLVTSFPKLEINQPIRDRVLELALEDEKDQPSKTISSTNTPIEGEKVLLRYFVAWNVLSRLGFKEERIRECLEKGMREGDGWEEGLEWMWLHCSENECLGRGVYAEKKAESLPEPEQSLPDLPLIEDPPELPEATLQPVTMTADRVSAATSTPTGPTSLFESLTTPSSPSLSSSSEPDLQKVNETWADLMLELDNLRIAAGGGPTKGKVKKGKSSGVVLETPEMRRLKEKISKVEKEYMFSRKDAGQDILLKTLKSRRDAQALEARLKGLRVRPGVGDAKLEESEVIDVAHNANGDVPVAEPSSMTIDVLAGSGDDDEGGLFGNMMDEPDPTSSTTTENTLITTRSMPIPKQFSFAGNTPKSLLRTSLSKSTSSKSAVITYAKLSGHSRAARAGLEIRWSGGKRKIWRMEDVGCDDMLEAENYVSTLALFELVGEGDVGGVNWRSLPVGYKDLWEELEDGKKGRDDEGRRKVWAGIKELVEGKTRKDVPDPVEGAVKVPGVLAEVKDVIKDVEPVYSEKLQTDFERRVSSPAYLRMRKQRDDLPIASFREQIISTLENSQIMVLSGETGCGKSTQLPSFILEDQLSKGRPVKIYVTEPRRISAISLAQRVSQELGDGPGSVGTSNSLVGYSIRLEAKVSASTRLAFVTNGIALRMLESGSGTGSSSKSTAFDEITHIIIDEVHERSIESDFLLIVLKSLMEQRKDLKVVLMSATLDAEKISNFFGGCPCLAVPGRTFPVQVGYLEDAVEVSGWSIDEGSSYAVRGRNVKVGAKRLEWEEGGREDDSDEEGDQDPTKLSSVKYSAKTVSTVNLLDSRQIAYDLIVRLLERICYEDEGLKRFSQATLVFMPGLAEIRRLNDMMTGHPAFGSRDFIIYPLHSTISSEGQSAVFDTPPPGVRKIVISTNIAETGVTIPDITCVIDSGKHREMRYDEKRQISRLVETYIARSNAKQRRGRAGRVQEGLAYHLFTKARHDTQLAEHPVPEMLRLSLQDLALRIKILRLKLGNSIEDVLSRALDPPSSSNIQRAIAALVEVKALTMNEEITPMGRLLSKLPMDVHLGKFLLVSALFRCLDPALTIAATLNSKSPFVTPFGMEHAADTAKRSFAVGNSDFMTLANVFNSWRRASDNPNFVRTFCRKNFVSQQNLQQIEELRQQLLGYLLDAGFVDGVGLRGELNGARFGKGFNRTRFVGVPREFDENAEDDLVLGAALAVGLYPKLISIESGGLKTIINGQPVAIHPSSVNFKIPKSDFGSSHLSYFTIMQSKKLYAWEVGPVDDRALALLCGDQADFRLSASSYQIDRKIKYRIEPKTLLAIKILREQFYAAMTVRMRGKAMSEKQGKWFDLGLQCIKTGIWDGDEGVVGVV